MDRRTTLAAASASLILAATAAPVGAQTMQSVAGTYALVSNPGIGDAPRGQMILTADGQYSSVLGRATLPKFPSGSRVKGTAEENKAIIEGTNTHYGTYTIDDGGKVLSMHIEMGTFPNWDGTTQKRTLKVSGDLLTNTVATPAGGGAPVEVVRKKIK